MDFSVIERAGLNQSQFAAFLGVTRVTVNTWINGHFRPSQAKRPRVYRALAILNEAVEDGRLPIRPQDTKAAVDGLLQTLADRLNTAEA